MWTFPDKASSSRYNPYPNSLLQAFALIDSGAYNTGVSDITIATNTIFPTESIVARRLTINAGITLTLSKGFTYIKVNELILNGIINCGAVFSYSSDYYYYNYLYGSSGFSYLLGANGTPPVYDYLFCGGSADNNSVMNLGGGKTVVGGNPNKAFWVKELLLGSIGFSSGSVPGPVYNGGITIATSAGCVVILANTITMGALGAIHADGSDSVTVLGGLSGSVGLIANNITFASGATLSADGGNSAAGHYGSGGGSVIVIARQSKTGTPTITVAGGTGSAGNGEAGSSMNTVWDFLSAF